MYGGVTTGYEFPEERFTPASTTTPEKTVKCRPVHALKQQRPTLIW